MSYLRRGATRIPVVMLSIATIISAE
jgi:hypothetical protein